MAISGMVRAMFDCLRAAGTMVAARTASPCREIPAALLSSLASGRTSSGRAVNNVYEWHAVFQ